MFQPEKLTLGRAALILAMSEDREEEERIKELIQETKKFKAVATEVGGPLNEFKQKVIKAAVGAAVNSQIVCNDPRKLHAVVHATLEAAEGILVASLGNPSIKIKMAIVTDGKWIAVAMYGVTALHVYTNHERTGLGIMHV